MSLIEIITHLMTDGNIPKYLFNIRKKKLNKKRIDGHRPYLAYIVNGLSMKMLVRIKGLFTHGVYGLM